MGSVRTAPAGTELAVGASLLLPDDHEDDDDDDGDDGDNDGIDHDGGRHGTGRRRISAFA